MKDDKIIRAVRELEAAKVDGVIAALKKVCRDTLGHEMGEPLLRKFAEAAVVTCIDWQ